MKLCVTGSFGNQDIGDDAMCDCWLTHLRSLGFSMKDVTLVGHQVKYTRWYFQHAGPVHSSRWYKDWVSDHDAMLVTGGGTINLRPGSNSLARIHRLVLPFILAGKPVFASGQTIGPLGSNFADRMALELVNGFGVLTVRDACESENWVNYLEANPKELISTVDDAVDLPMDSDVDTAHLNYPTVAMNLSQRKCYSEDRFVRVSKALVDKGWNILMIPHHPKDAERMGMVIKHLDSNRVRMWDLEQKRAGGLKRAISRCQAAIGCRYHFLVFALSTGVPCVGLAGDEYGRQKMEGFAHQMKWTSIMTTDEPNQVLDEFEEAVDMKPCRPPSSISFIRFTRWLKELE